MLFVVFSPIDVDHLLIVLTKEGLEGTTSDKVLPPGGDMHKCKVLIMLIREDRRK